MEMEISKFQRIRSRLKYFFWKEQELESSQADALKALREEEEGVRTGQLDNISSTWFQRLLIKHRRPIALLTPAAIFHFFWWSAMIKNNSWYLFKDNYFMSLTMMGGSIIAGMTSEGGGAVAFPVMTLAFSIAPAVARDFSIMIQSIGMSAASLTIILMRVRCEWQALGLSSIGGLFGLVFGLEFIDQHISPSYKKLGFVSVWFAFASVLFFLILFRRGQTYMSVQNWTAWRRIVFIITGFVGGLATAFVGNGLDICTFSILTLVFHVNERVATPTSVILMAINSIAAVIWRGAIVQGISIEAWNFLAVCIPIVVLGAPLGSVIGSHLHRVVLAMLVVILDVISFVAAFIIIPMSVTVGLVMGGLVVLGIGFFAILTYLGQRLQHAMSQQVDEIVVTSPIDDNQLKENIPIEDIPRKDVIPTEDIPKYIQNREEYESLAANGIANRATRL